MVAFSDSPTFDSCEICNHNIQKYDAMLDKIANQLADSFDENIDVPIAIAVVASILERLLDNQVFDTTDGNEMRESLMQLAQESVNIASEVSHRE